MGSSLRFSVAGTIGKNFGSPFTIPLTTCGGCGQPGRALLLLPPMWSLQPVEPPFAWLISCSFPNSLAASKRGEGGGRVLSQFCRKCKGNYAGYSENRWHFHVVKSAFLSGILSHFALTIGQKMGLLERRTFPSQESIMSDEKLKALRQSHALHPHP